ncbi:hypothetical protein SNEBB_001422 [Seison nebaliae]|nr:hypothetical protein SNEBB_001422 [Seison nebaliae]
MNDLEVNVENDQNDVVEDFKDMNLKEDLTRGVYGYGFEKPSVIQARAIMPCIRGVDVIAQAQSGTGKTATFCIAILQRVKEEIKQPQALVLAPTRELADQNSRVMAALGRHLNLTYHLCIGGTDISDDAQKCQSAQIIVGTPGRVFDMIQRRHLTTSKIHMLVMDEADEMLKRGFLEQIMQIFATLPKSLQTILISATMPEQVMEVTNQFMQTPVKIMVKKEQLTLEGIRQYYINVSKEEFKLEVLFDIYKSLKVSQCVIFCNSRRKVTYVANELLAQQHTVSSLHGEMTQQQREQIMNQFRSGSSRILITTDVLSRGIDVQQVTLVINYDLPKNRETYIHRIGRSGRFGRKGTAINFITEEEKQELTDLQNHYSTSIVQMPKNINEVL